MTAATPFHDARRFRLSAAWLRVPFGIAGAAVVAAATYATFGPISDARAWQLAGVRDTGVVGAATHLAATPPAPRRLAARMPTAALDHAAAAPAPRESGGGAS